MRKFENKIVLITGGGSGIGLKTAILFAEQGAKVIICGRDKDKGETALQLIKKINSDADFFRCDVSKENEVESMISKIIEKFGRLDIAVNNAGISPKRSSFIEYTEEIFNQVMDINVKGLFFCMKHEIKEMIKNNKGIIVNTSSIMGLKAFNMNHSLYITSKHAATGLTKAAALEYAAKGIRINGVCPGGVDTEIHNLNTGSKEAKKAMADMHPMKRLAEPEEIAKSIAFLCSEDSSFITGAMLEVSGGA